MLIFDFDGTLFNTLPVVFKIHKKRLKNEDEILVCHQEYIAQTPSLNEYAAVWKEFFINITSKKIILISESNTQILTLYLDFFDLRNHFTYICGGELSATGQRERTLKSLTQRETSAHFITDNRRDLEIEIEHLNLHPSNQFFAADLSHFKLEIKKLQEAINWTTQNAL